MLYCAHIVSFHSQDHFVILHRSHIDNIHIENITSVTYRESASLSSDLVDCCFLILEI